MRLIPTNLIFLSLVSFGCGAGDSGTDPEFELPFTPATPLTVSTVQAYDGALELALAPAGNPCGSRTERKSFNQQAMIRIALVAVDQAGELALVDEPWPDAQDEAVPSINGFTGFLLKAGDEPRNLEQMHQSALRGTGTVFLDVVPNYDTGRTLGRYDLRFADYTYQGTFDASYCARNVTANVKLLALDLMTWCEVGFDAPLQPGSLWSNTPRFNTMGRDLGRGLRAEGMTDVEAACLSEAVQQCKDNLTDWESIFGSPRQVTQCRLAFAKNCFQYPSAYFEECATKMIEAGLSVPSVP